MRRIVSGGYTASSALEAYVERFVSEPSPFTNGSINRALPCMLLHPRRRLGHRCNGVLRIIRTSELHERIRAGAALTIVQGERVTIAVVGSSGFYGSSKHMREGGTSAFEFFPAASSQEGDQEEYEADDCDSANNPSSYGTFVWLLC